jgi:hypothetical protein
MRWFRLSVFILANVLTLCVASNDLMAQRPGGGGGQGGGAGGGGRGFGGGGMMMGRGGGGVSGLLRMEEVQKELKLTDEQKKTITDEGTKMGEAMREIFSGFGRGTEVTDESRKKMEEGQKKLAEMAKTFEKSLETILDPDQQDRLIGLMLQRSGVRAATSSEMVAASLEITEEQKTKFAEAEKQNGEEMAKAMEGMGGRRPRGEDAGGEQQSDEDRAAQIEKFRKKMEEMNKAAEERLLAVLTDDQKSKIESLKGEKFTFPEPQFGGFGGGGGGGGPGGRPGRGNRPGGGGN